MIRPHPMTEVTQVQIPEVGHNWHIKLLFICLFETLYRFQQFFSVIDHQCVQGQASFASTWADLENSIRGRGPFNFFRISLEE